MKNFIRSISLYIIIFIIIIIAILISNQNLQPAQTKTYTYDTLIAKIYAGDISNLKIQKDADVFDAGKAFATLKDSSQTVIEADVLSISQFMSFVHAILDNAGSNNKLVIETVEAPRTSWLLSLLPSIFIMFMTVFLLMFILQQAQGGGGGGNRVMSFGKSKAKVNIDEKKRVTFANVAGLEEEKAEVEELVEFLKQPKKFVDLGARIPKGVLLVGPPGTGKTLLARAVAGEAGVPFFSISGSDFVEMFVGVGASRVRDLFEQAKKNAPCIIFIDEIDAVGRRRGAGLGGGHDEREQTLNQLLVEMDGFGVNEGVIVVAATNRPDILDPAILRPGRFDRQVVVGRPDVKGREEILNVHANGKPLDTDVDLKIVAQTTAGFTGADLENLLNEAALLAARGNKKKIDMVEIGKAYVKVGIGTEKKSRVISEKERRITAYHEAGHGILQEVLSELDPVHSMSVIPTGMAGGYTMHIPEGDKFHLTKKFMEQEIVSLLGGRAAEYIVIEDITTGASNDIERATAIARNMVTKYGMSEKLGPIQFGNDSQEVFIGRDFANSRNYGEEIASSIDQEIRRMVQTAYEQALELLNQNIDILHNTAKLLIEKEKITGDEFRALIKKTERNRQQNENESSLFGPEFSPSI